MNENVWISLNIPLKFVPRDPINNIPALVQIMAWRRPGDKPLSEPMLVFVPTHICVTRPQWVNTYIVCISRHHWVNSCIFVYPFLHFQAKLRYDPVELDPEDMCRFAAEQPQVSAGGCNCIVLTIWHYWNVNIYFVNNHYNFFFNIATWTACVYHVDFHVLQNKWYIYIYMAT